MACVHKFDSCIFSFHVIEIHEPINTEGENEMDSASQIHPDYVAGNVITDVHVAVSGGGIVTGFLK